VLPARSQKGVAAQDAQLPGYSKYPPAIHHITTILSRLKVDGTHEGKILKLGSLALLG
jgi:hypothetical protein